MLTVLCGNEESGGGEDGWRLRLVVEFLKVGDIGIGLDERRRGKAETCSDGVLREGWEDSDVQTSSWC